MQLTLDPDDKDAVLKALTNEAARLKVGNRDSAALDRFIQEIETAERKPVGSERVIVKKTKRA